MTGHVGKTTNQSREVIGAQTQGEREDQLGEMPGKIVSFDASKQTAKVQPMYKPRHNGKPVDMPELLDVPIRFPRAGKGAITMPVEAGDLVTLRPQMRSSENWHVDGDYTASDTRSFHLSDMEGFLDGGESLKDPIPNFDADNVHVRFDPDGNYGIRGSADGKIKVEGSQGNIYTLTRDAIDLSRQTAAFLATEPDLVHTAGYASIAAQLQTIVDKLSAMAL